MADNQTTQKKSVLIFQTEISAYDVECYNIISDYYDLTLAYFTKDKAAKECRFKKVKLDSSTLGPFTFVKGVKILAKQYDVVCIPPNLHFPSYCILPFLPHKYKIVSWSIGFRVSYVHPYRTERKHNILDWVFKKVLDACDANIFYMDKAKDFWHGKINLNKVFVAINTTQVNPLTIIPERKNSILFVGTLYKGKGVEKLLETYMCLLDKTDNPLPLIVVGDGPERNVLEEFVTDHHLDNIVSFKGAIYDENILMGYYSQALISVSPNQAGLSVPKSMGYGVPYATRRDAITGGEIYHITDGVNGFMYENDEDLLEILLDASNNPSKYVAMGRRAKDYYDNNATVNHRAKGAMAAFNYVLSH